MAFEEIVLEKEDQIATITLNRPQKRNALTYRMTVEMLSAIDDVGRDKDIRVVVLTGAGEAFSAGGDYKFAEVLQGKISTRQAEDLWVEQQKAGHPPGQLLTSLHDIIIALPQLGKPVIAMLKGDVVGGGFGISLACDMRVGASNTRFMIAYSRLGLVPTTGEQWILPRLVGVSKALELMMTSEFVSAEEAYRIGLLNRLVPVEELENETKRLAHSLIRIPPLTQRLMKQEVYSALETDARSSLMFSFACCQLTMGARDQTEAVKAFAERRAPIYTDPALFEE
jgi:2-(1,2-epoxy-1,2-dihydrophenyl)acetyl-CoA isomerase